MANKFPCNKDSDKVITSFVTSSSQEDLEKFVIEAYNNYIALIKECSWGNVEIPSLKQWLKEFKYVEKGEVWYAQAND